MLYSLPVHCFTDHMSQWVEIAQAEEEVIARLPLSTTETVSLDQSLGRILRTPISADRPIPPFDRAMMDGVAIDSSEFFGLGTELRLAGTQAAGSPALEKWLPDTCFEVMTGAPIPIGCDCVIPVEEISITEDSVIFSPDAIGTSGQFIHPLGSDAKDGQELVSAGYLLGPAELAIAASVGQTELTVSKRPHVAIITSGDEVIPPHQHPTAYQIRQSHPTALINMLQPLVTVNHHHISDDLEETERVLQQAVQNFDFVILTGGVSKGKFDYIAPTLNKLLGEPVFHGIRQRPGKPMGFWHTPNGPIVFGLPGNPVSVMATASRYVLPALKHHLQLRTPHSQTIQLAQPFSWKADIPGFAPVAFDNEGRHIISPMRNSGDYLCLAGCVGMAELPTPKHTYTSSDALQLYPFF